jgi:hypothetical protein
MLALNISDAEVRLKPEWGSVIFVPPAEAGGYSRILFLQNYEYQLNRGLCKKVFYGASRRIIF